MRAQRNQMLIRAGGTALVLASTGLLGACDQDDAEDTVEEVQDNLEDAADDVGDAIEDAADDVGDAIDDATDG
ncbi:MAG: hypothetical protein R3B49_01900 [Phycisphaerales bacterium]